MGAQQSTSLSKRLSEGRFNSVDLVSGIAMVIMLLDHTRDFTHVAAMQFDPMDNERSTLAITSRVG
ncbi:MAG TPA: hypothetical protein VE869_05560 [Gemmatimonas sp.]|nr:hypothetical protein [Gemmatimonas sp.]